MNDDSHIITGINNIGAAQSITPISVSQTGNNMMEFETMMMEAPYIGTEPLDLNANFNSMSLLTSPTNHHHSESPYHFVQHQEQIIPMNHHHHDNNNMYITSTPIVKSHTNPSIKDEELWSLSSSYQPPPHLSLDTSIPSSWSYENGNHHPINDHHDINQWHANLMSPIFQDIGVSDISTSPPHPVPYMVPIHHHHHHHHVNHHDMVPKSMMDKNKPGRRHLPRRHTVSTVYNPLPMINNTNNNNNNNNYINNSNNFNNNNNNNMNYINQQQPYSLQQIDSTITNNNMNNNNNNNQQVKMRKMLKARRHRSLGRLEVSSNYLTKMEAAINPISPTSLSCNTSRCASPLSAEYMSHSQSLDHCLSNLDHHPSSSPPFLSDMDHPTLLSYPPLPPLPSYLVQPIFHSSSVSSSSSSPPQQTMNDMNHHSTLIATATQQIKNEEMYSSINTMIPANNNNSNNNNNINNNGTTTSLSPINRSPQEESSSDHEHLQAQLQQEMDGPQICKWAGCHYEFSLLDQLIEHVKVDHIGSGLALYYCQWKDCVRNQKPFTKRHKIYNHLRTHTGERPFVCTEEGCGKRFSRPDSLSTHAKIHTNIRPYVCPHENCDKAYYHLRSLRKHEKSHETPPPLPPINHHHFTKLESKE
ncbi:unnamed protein product [Cunninghamella blakesleeana]